MTIAIETYLVVALAFAVFAAVTALGSSLVLGAGFERLRAGFEIIKSQTGFFSDAIHGLGKRMDMVEKQGKYFFQSIHDLEQRAMTSAQKAEDPVATEPHSQQLICASKSAEPEKKAQTQSVTQILWGGSTGNEVRFH